MRVRFIIFLTKLAARSTAANLRSIIGIPPLVEFVKKWNDLKLMPKLRLATAFEAMGRIEQRIGRDLPAYSGEWPDWWAFGVAASPRDLAASRLAGLYAQAALSPVWGGNSEPLLNKVEEIDRSLCQYYEHTFAHERFISLKRIKRNS